MKEEVPLVSVLMTAFNRQSFIREAIESVLASTYTNFELIIVDDCSTDNTVTIAQNYMAADNRIKLFVNDTNLGQFRNRNKAAGFANGAYIKYVDSDDVIYPQCLEVMVNSMRKFPEAGLGFCHSIGESNKPFPYLITPVTAFRKHYFDGGLLYTGPIGLIFNTAAFRKVNAFEEFGMPSDNHLSLKIASAYPVVALPRDLFWWRAHNEGRAFDDLSSLRNIFDHYNFNKDLLQNAVCPLPENEKRKALVSGKINFSRGVVRNLFKKPSDFGLVKLLLKQHHIDFAFVLKNLF